MIGIPTIRLADKVYNVPALVPAQLKYVLPAIMQTAPALSDPAKFTPDIFNKLLEIIYYGIIWANDPNRDDASKRIKFKFLDELPIGMDEIREAVRLVQQQTGLFKKLPKFPVTWDALVGAAGEWRSQQNRPAIDGSLDSEDIQGAMQILVARSVMEADPTGEAQH